MNPTLISILAAASYLASAAIIMLRLFGDRLKRQPPRLVAIGIGGFGVALHSYVLYENVVTASGLNLGFFNAFSVAAWIVILVLLISALSKPVENLGIFLLPLGAITLLLELIYPTSHLLTETSPWGLRLHVLISLLAYALLTLAAFQSILLAIQDKHLHNRHPGGFVRALPPLQTMEALLFEMIWVGFALLSVSLISGFMFLENMFAQHLVHKTVLSIVSWLVFGTLLWGRFRFGWRGRVAIRWTLTGFGVLVLAYFGSKFVIELIIGKTA